MIPVVVAPGDTLSGIAAQYGVSYQSIAAASGIGNPNLIYAGQTVEVPTGGGSSTPAPVQSNYTPPQSPSSTSYTPAPTPSAGGGLGDIPGMPSGLASCIAYRESTNDTNPAADGNAYGIIPASGYNVAGDSLAQQNQVAGEIYAQDGGGAWAADGCPGT